MGPIPGFASPGPKVFQAGGGAGGGAAASDWFMVDTGAGLELRLRSGQGKAKGEAGAWTGRW